MKKTEMFVKTVIFTEKSRLRHSVFLRKFCLRRQIRNHRRYYFTPTHGNFFLKLESDSLDSFGLCPNELPDIPPEPPTVDSSGLPNIRGPRRRRLSHSRRGQNQPTPAVTPTPPNPPTATSDSYPTPQRR